MNRNELSAAERFSRNAQIEPLFGSSNGAVADVLALGDKYRNRAPELTTDDQAAILKMHNDARVRYGLAPLKWSNNLAKIAQQWADTCYWGHWKAQRTKQALGSDYFPPPRQMGENLSVWFDPGSTMLAGQYGTQLWLDEEGDYQCGEPIGGTDWQKCNEARASGQAPPSNLDCSECKPGTACGHWTQMMWSGSKEIGCALRTCEDGLDSRSWPSRAMGQPNVKYLVCEYSPAGNFTGEVPFSSNKCGGGAAPGAGARGTPQVPPTTGRRNGASNDANDNVAQQNNINRRTPVIPTNTPGAGMVAQNENMSSVPAFFAGMGRQDRIGSAPRRAAPFVPGGLQFIDQNLQTPAAAPVVNGPVAPPIVQNNANNKNNTAQGNGNEMNENDTNFPPPAPMPAMTSEPPKSDSAKIAWTAGGALAVSAALGAALGAGFYFLNKSGDRKNR